MKQLLVILTIALPAFASEDIKTFRCVTDTVIEENKPTKINFQVQNLGKEEVNYYTEDPDDYDPVDMVPEDSNLMLNDNWGIEQGADRLIMTSDGDGCQWTDFVLFADSGYTKGYVRITDGGCGAKPAYSTVTCEMN